MPNTRASGNAAESCIGEQGHMLSKIEMFQCRRHLVNLFHARSHGSAADEHHNIARLQLPRFDSGDGRRLSHEDTRRSYFPVDAVIPHDAGIDGGALDHRTQRGKIAVWKTNSRSQPALVRRLWI